MCTRTHTWGNVRETVCVCLRKTVFRHRPVEGSVPDLTSSHSFPASPPALGRKAEGKTTGE